MKKERLITYDIRMSYQGTTVDWKMHDVLVPLPPMVKPKVSEDFAMDLKDELAMIKEGCYQVEQLDETDSPYHIVMKGSIHERDIVGNLYLTYVFSGEELLKHYDYTLSISILEREYYRFIECMEKSTEMLLQSCRDLVLPHLMLDQIHFQIEQALGDLKILTPPREVKHKKEPVTVMPDVVPKGVPEIIWANLESEKEANKSQYFYKAYIYDENRNKIICQSINDPAQNTPDCSEFEMCSTHAEWLTLGRYDGSKRLRVMQDRGNKYPLVDLYIFKVIPSKEGCGSGIPCLSCAKLIKDIGEKKGIRRIYWSDPSTKGGMYSLSMQEFKQRVEAQEKDPGLKFFEYTKRRMDKLRPEISLDRAGFRAG